MSALRAVEPCPCGSGVGYAACCGPYLLGARVPTAEALMRSRYTAFAVGHVAHLTRTWHPRTRPASLELDPRVRWTGLDVLQVVLGGATDEMGEVAFEARFTGPDGPGVLRERSRFERRGGRWTYLDGDHVT